MAPKIITAQGNFRFNGLRIDPDPKGGRFHIENANGLDVLSFTLDHRALKVVGETCLKLAENNTPAMKGLIK